MFASFDTPSLASFDEKIYKLNCWRLHSGWKRFLELNIFYVANDILSVKIEKKTKNEELCHFSKTLKCIFLSMNDTAIENLLNLERNQFDVQQFHEIILFCSISTGR